MATAAYILLFEKGAWLNQNASRKLNKKKAVCRLLPQAHNITQTIFDCKLAGCSQIPRNGQSAGLSLLAGASSASSVSSSAVMGLLTEALSASWFSPSPVLSLLAEVPSAS